MKFRNILSRISSPSIAITTFCLFVFTGICNIILTKLQNETNVKGPGSFPPVKFQHPGFQTFLMFVGMALFLPFFYIRSSLSKLLCFLSPISRESEKENESKRKLRGLLEGNNSTPNSPSSIPMNDININAKPSKNTIESDNTSVPSSINVEKKGRLNPLYFLISATADCLKFFIFFGLFYTYASVSEMLKPTVIVSTYILSVVFLKNRVYLHQIVGILIVLLGSVLVASSVFTKNKSLGDTHNTFMGAMFVVLGKFFDSLGIILEEKFMKGSDNSPDECVGYEGFFGLCIFTCVLALIYLFPGGENTPALTVEVFHSFSKTFSSQIFLYLVLLTLSIGFYHFFGILITKHRSSLTRTVTDTIRALAIWIIQILRKRDSYSSFQLSGFLLILLGNAIYHEILRIPVYHHQYLSSKKEGNCKGINGCKKQRKNL